MWSCSVVEAVLLCSPTCVASHCSSRPSREMPSAHVGDLCSGIARCADAFFSVAAAWFSCRRRSRIPLRLSSVCFRLRRAPARLLFMYWLRVDDGTLLRLGISDEPT